MNQADLINACQVFEDENGVGELLCLLNDIMLCRAQANNLNIQYLEDDELPDVVAETIQ